MPDNRLQLGYGSAWHVLRCLGWRRDQFTNHVAQSIGLPSIDWLDFRAGGGGEYPTGAPIRDSEWTRINFASKEVQSAYDTFWPTRGTQQNWDLIGRGSLGPTENEIILVEAKSHTGEISFDGTTAAEDGGRPLIRNAFRDTLLAMGRDSSEAESLAEEWLKGCYQHANRLATLYFLLDHKIPARLVFLYFCGDSHPHGRFDCPADPAGWAQTIAKIQSNLGLSGKSALETRVHDVFVNVDSIDTGKQL